ncbi:sugar phosphate isomerase/epimerase family protein [Mucilaginibacter psychrotolerans]|uniref:Sugar phosphate isomerase/epimerase n=1 Tax=Mucilaginibacter psychrotolerans TaxID=1524096 RepID=A0A4Y8RZM7_9SPHI|nr:sugar phosphate isomerase/epimerase [Mucilaginibacter psychrotolerans]TFF30441.1 sugar phosphate isomerase/epimerase [Mucilaginibacter psychrotolerans]
MQIKFFCPRWGSHQSWESFCKLGKEAGFDGVESPLSGDKEEETEMMAALEKYGLLYIGQYYQSFEQDFGLHKQSYQTHLRHLAALNPVLIDAQTGKDYFTEDQNRELFAVAQKVSDDTGVIIAHETHRNKALFAAHIAKDLLANNPEAVITADFSHWCNVSESLLEQQQEAMEIAISRTVHIHARVGNSQSAQVSDPRADEWKAEVAAHLNWWDDIVKYRLNKGADLLTITPEFGPDPYMPALPYSKMPVANQWDINVYMMKMLKHRYKELESR